MSSGSLDDGLLATCGADDVDELECEVMAVVGPHIVILGHTSDGFHACEVPSAGVTVFSCHGGLRTVDPQSVRTYRLLQWQRR